MGPRGDDDRAHERDRTRDRDHRRDHRDGAYSTRDAADHPDPSNDRRNRSRSPRRERGGRRSENNRYRSRSPIRRNQRGDRDDRRKDARGGWGPRPSGGNGRDSAPNSQRAGGPAKETTPTVDVEMADSNRPEGMDDDTWQMRKIMGFTGFKSTKDTKVPGNDKNFGVRKDKKMEARQYMNRQGGFNRPLSPGRS